MAEAFSVAVSPHNYNSTTIAMAAMLTVLIGFGLILSVDLHRDVAIPRYPGGDR